MRILTTAVIVACALGLAAGCGAAPTPAAPPRVMTARPAGAWNGTGSQTVGDVASESGHLRIRWTARAAPPGAAGAFRLTVCSAVSGRPMQVVVDHRGTGAGTVDFVDMPRAYQFLVESDQLEWSFEVDEVYEANAPPR